MKPIQTVILRHWRENLKKCSLQALKNHPNLLFIDTKPNFSFDASNFTLLAVDAQEISPSDNQRPLLLLDSTWKLLPNLLAGLTGSPQKRSLPSTLKTSYPRISKVHPDPLSGLASIEALYAALRLLGQRDDSLLENYYWKNQFLQQYED